MDNAERAKRLRELIRLMERKLGVLEDGEMSCCGVSLTQCHALVEIGRAGSISLVDLAGILDLENSTMSRTVNNLVTSGMAERAPDPNDRRYVTIRLTDEGLKTFKDIEDGMNQYFEQILTVIPDGKKEQVLESLEILLEAIANSECCS